MDNLHIDHLHRHRHTALVPRLSSPWSVKLVDTYKTRLRIPYLPVGLELRLAVLHLAASASALASASSSTSFPLTLSRLGLVKTAGWRLLHFAARIPSRWVVLLLIVFCQSHPFGPADFYPASRRSPVSVDGSHHSIQLSSLTALVRLPLLALTPPLQLLVGRQVGRQARKVDLRSIHPRPIRQVRSGQAQTGNGRERLKTPFSSSPSSSGDTPSPSGTPQSQPRIVSYCSLRAQTEKKGQPNTTQHNTGEQTSDASLGPKTGGEFSSWTSTGTLD